MNLSFLGKSPVVPIAHGCYCCCLLAHGLNLVPHWNIIFPETTFELLSTCDLTFFFKKPSSFKLKVFYKKKVHRDPKRIEKSNWRLQNGFGYIFNGDPILQYSVCFLI